MFRGGGHSINDKLTWRPSFLYFTAGNFRFVMENKMQPETVDFVSVPPPGEVDETYASLTLAHWLHYVKT